MGPALAAAPRTPVRFLLEPAAESCGEHRGGGDDHDEAHHEHPGEAAGRATPTRGVDVRLDRLARRVDGVGRLGDHPGRDGGQQRHVHRGASLKAWRTGPDAPIATRVIEGWPTRVRHGTSLTPPSAHDTTDLIGDTWVTTTTSRSRAISTSSSHAAATRAFSSASDSPPGGRQLASVRSACHTSGDTSEVGSPSISP